MFSIQYILSLFKQTKASQIIFFLMGVSLIQITDLILSIFLTHYFGDYLILALISLLSLVGLFSAVLCVNKRVEIIIVLCDDGTYPENEYFQFSAVFLAAMLLFIPGFISSFLGLIILFRPVSALTGRIISKKAEIDWNTVYEYMKI